METDLAKYGDDAYKKMGRISDSNVNETQSMPCVWYI